MKFNFKNIFLIAVSIFASIALLIIGKPNFNGKSERVILNLEGKNYNLLTARTWQEKIRGLSGITELKNADGMIFYFETPQKIILWNKDTHLDLELVWMSGNEILGKDFLPSEDKTGLVVKGSPVEVDKVVELVK